MDLLERVGEGTFREDLYYRLQVVTIHTPPLRERREDLQDLVPALLTRINREMQTQVNRVAVDVMNALHAYDWPGNIRELENVLRKAVALCPGDTITQDLIPKPISGEGGAPKEDDRPLSEWSLRDIEGAHIARVLEGTHWHRGRACEILGISRPRLRRLINQYGLTPPAGIVENNTDTFANGDEE